MREPFLQRLQNQQPSSSRRQLVTGTAVGVLLAGLLTACGPTRSVESYCEVMAEHKDRFLSATEEASTADPLTSIATLITAMGDLNRMWEEAAEVAPEEIQRDVEDVRDAWAQQLAAAEEMASNPLGGLASSLMTGMTSAGSMQRVDTYTAEHCPEVGAMFFAAEATSPPDAQTPTGSPTTGSGSSTPANSEPSPTPTRDDPVNVGTGWSSFGPFLVSTQVTSDAHELAHSPPRVFVADVGEIDVEVKDILGDADTVGQQYFYFSDADEPQLAGLATIREPSSGLEPEGYYFSVFSMDLASGKARLAERMESDKTAEEPNVVLAGTAGDNIIVVQTQVDDEYELVAYDLKAQDIAWQQSGASIARPGAADFGWITDPAEAVGLECTSYSYDSELSRDEVTYHWMDLATGTPAFSMPLMVSDQEDEICRTLGFPLSSRFSTVERYSMSEYATAGYYVLDRETEETPQVPGPVAFADPVGTAGLIMHRSERISETESADLIVVDLSTGDEWFRIEEERAEALDLQVVSLFDEVLYLITTDDQVAVDVRSGQELGSWSVYPVNQVGSYTHLNDGTLHKNWTFDGA